MRDKNIINLSLKVSTYNPAPFRDWIVMADRGQKASFGSFRIAVIRRLWVTILMIENDVCMVNKRMIVFAKRFALPSPKRLRAGRSKAPSAASLSPIELVDGRRIAFDFDFLPTPYCDTVS